MGSRARSCKIRGLGIRTIDISALLDPERRSEDFGATLHALGDAARSTGTFYAVGHGIPSELIATSFELAREFFRDADPEKVAILSHGRPRGYTPLPEGPGDFKEWFACALGLDTGAAAGHMGTTNLWPSRPERFADALRALMPAMHAAGRAVLRGLALELGVGELTFDALFEPPGGGILRVLRYPSVAGLERPGVPPHSDLPPLMLIAQDQVTALSTKNLDGTWEPVKPVEGALVCQTGDLLARWTADRYVANVHQVVNASDSDRLSLVWFMFPDFEQPFAHEAGTEPRPFARVFDEWLRAMDSEDDPHLYPKSSA